MDRQLWMLSRTLKLKAASGDTTITAVLSQTAVSGTVTTGASTTTFAATGLGSTNSYLGRVVRMVTVTNAANLNAVRYVSSYVRSTQTFTVTPGFPANVTVADTFEVIAEIPSGNRKIAVISANVAMPADYLTDNFILNVTQTPADKENVFTGAVRWIANFDPYGQFVKPPLPVMFDSSYGDLTVTVAATGAMNGSEEFFLQWTPI